MDKFAQNKAEKPKVLIVSLAYSPFWGGAELAVKEITDRISDIEFDMVTLRFKKSWPTQEKTGNINIHRISSSKLLFPFNAYFKTRKLHKKNNYNIIWSIMANRAGFTTLFFKLSFPKIKYLLTLQEGDPFGHPKKRAGIVWLFVGWMFKYIFRKADYIQTISNYLADWAENMGAKKKNIKVVPNGVDVKRFKNYDLRFKNDNETILISTSRLVKKNGLGDLIDATKILIDENYKIKTLILGEGPLKNNLKFKIKNLKLQNEVLLIGHIDSEKIPQYLQKADIFIRPSLSEGLGSSFLEAMATGLPIIGTPVGGIPDFLKHEETGLLAKPNNPESIAKQVKLLLNNNELKNKIAENGQKLVFQKYNWDNIAQRMKKILIVMSNT